MVNVAREGSGNSLTIRLSGPIEESVNFDEIVGSVPGELRVITKDVPRINSVGVKAWIKFFQGVAAKGTKITFAECSTAIVEQINLISNFTAGGKVESIYVPFACGQCKAELIGLFKCDALKAAGLNIPDLQCSKCPGKAVFDDIPEEYLGFLER
jgi:hypothetical protein